MGRQLELAVVRALEEQQRPSYKADAAAVAAVLEQQYGDNALRVAQEIVGLLLPRQVTT